MLSFLNKLINLFSALHEDVSKGEKSRGYTEPRTASEAWSQYNRRENSRIVDLFVGQLKSSLKCSTCGYVSEVKRNHFDQKITSNYRFGTHSGIYQFLSQAELEMFEIVSTNFKEKR